MKRILGSTFFVFLFIICFGQLAFAQDFSISSGVPVEATMSSSYAENTYNFSTNQDGEVYITLDQTTGGFSMYLYDQNGNNLGGDYYSSRGNNIVINRDLSKGNYYVKVSAYGWNGISSASYRLKTTYAASIKRNSSTFEPNDTFETGLAVKSGQIYKSTSETSIDRDVYQFTTNKDGEVYIVLDDTTGGFSMYLYDDNGNNLGGDYYSSRGNKIVINKQVQRGKYYVKVTPYGWSGITSATYRLKATYPGSISRNASNFEPNETIETSLAIISGKNYYSSSYTSTDRDVYRITTNRDGQASITLDNTTGGFSMYLYDINGNNLGGDYYSSRGNTIKIVPTLSKGTYYIRITPYGWNGITTATYRLKASFLDKVPTVNSISDHSTVITGKAESNVKVHAWAGSKKLGEATARSGKYTIKISKQKAGTVINVYTVDGAQNRSANRTVTVLDRTAPSAPIVNKVTSKTVKLSGKAERYATVYVYNKSKRIGTGKVDSKGYFKVTIKAQKKWSTLTVYVKDKAGNKSKNKSVRVY